MQTDWPLSKKSAGSIINTMGNNTSPLKYNINRTLRNFLAIIAIFWFQGLHKDTDKVNQCPDSASSGSKKLNNSLPDVSHIETVNANFS
jgi:hypothetical protein